MAVALVGLGACAPEKTDAPKPSDESAAVATPAAPNAATLTAAELPRDAGAENGDAASVAKVIHLDREGAKLYSTIGGDPAINGEYVFLAVDGGPAEGWRIYKVGDFNTWELVEQSPERVVLKVSHSAVAESGDIVTYEQKIAVAIPAPDAAVESVALTPVD